MNIDEVQQLGAAVELLRKHGYLDAATVVTLVVEKEFALIAESLR